MRFSNKDLAGTGVSPQNEYGPAQKYRDALRKLMVKNGKVRGQD